MNKEIPRDNVSINSPRTLEKYADLLACFFISLFIAALFAIFLKINGVYLFGKDIMSSYDMLAQVAPFIEHFFDVLSGKSSLFYSYAIAGGADVFGTLAYCCISPFTFIFLLFGKGNVYYGTSIVLPLKIICVALSAYIYLKKRFGGLPIALKVVLSLSYAFCGYLYVSNTYINWVDILIYLPLAAYGFGKMAKTGKKAAFVAGLSLIIYTCFSIGCFSLLLMYPIAISYCLIVVEKDKRRKTIVDLVVSLCLTIAFCLPVLVPALGAYLVSGRSSGLFSGLFSELKADPVYYKVSYIMTDGITLFFTFVYFIKNGVKRPIDRFLLVAAFVTLLPVLCDECCILLNFGSYYSYALRFGFLNGFYFFFVAASYFSDRAFDRTKEIVKPAEEPEQSAVQKSTPEPEQASALKPDREAAKKSGKTAVFNNERKLVKNGLLQRVLWSAIPAALCLGGLIGGYFLCVAAQNDKIEKYFSARFAHSLGGLEVTAIVFGIVAIIALSGTLLLKFRKILPRFAAAILLVTVCGQCAFYAENLVYGNKKSTTDFDQIGVLTDYVQTLDGGKDARVKFYSDYLTADMPFTLHTNAYSVFSSVIDDANFVPPRFFGFEGNGNNVIKSYNGTFFGDCLFGNEYYITKSSYTERNYEAVKGYDQDAAGGYRLYKSLYAFPHAFVTPGRCGSFEDDDDLYVKYDSLLKTLGGEEFAPETISVKNSIGKDADGGYKFSFTRNKSGVYFAVVSDELASGATYVVGSDESKVKLGEDRSINLQKKSAKYSSFTLFFDGETADGVNVGDYVTVYCVTDDMVKKLSERVRAHAGAISLKAGEITVNAAAGEGEFLFLNYVALPGHTAFVNGKETKIVDDYLGFMLIPLEEGKNTVRVVYRSPYIRYAIFGLIAALLIAALYLFVIKKLNVYADKFARAVEVAAYSLCATIAVFFFAFPVCVFLYKTVALVIKTLIRLF